MSFLKELELMDKVKEKIIEPSKVNNWRKAHGLPLKRTNRIERLRKVHITPIESVDWHATKKANKYFYVSVKKKVAYAKTKLLNQVPIRVCRNKNIGTLEKNQLVVVLKQNKEED